MDDKMEYPPSDQVRVENTRLCFLNRYKGFWNERTRRSKVEVGRPLKWGKVREYGKLEEKGKTREGFTVIFSACCS